MNVPADSPPSRLAAVFRAETLPRWRAVLAVCGFGAALLAAGGMLEYGSGSPAIQGTPAATYWMLFFALNMVAFGGAALLAGFPMLARGPLKLGWLAALIGLYLAAFGIWYGQQPDPALSEWFGRSPAYLPSAIATVIGLLMRGWGDNPPAVAPETPVPPRRGQG